MFARVDGNVEFVPANETATARKNHRRKIKIKITKTKPLNSMTLIKWYASINGVAKYANMTTMPEKFAELERFGFIKPFMEH